jgi:cellulose synthase/poly-beta-1,6-N-acetylglucosamine synthase-like glycosyltransferase
MHLFCTAVAAAAVSLIVYVVAIYPVLLGIISSRMEKPIRKDSTLRAVSIVMAVRNGEKFIERKLRSIFGLNYPRELMQIIVVSDGSEDGTDAIARSFEPEGVHVIRVPRGGKCAALNAGVSAATNEILVFTDVRQTLDPDCLRNAIASFGDPSVGAVSAELHIRSGQSEDERNTGLYWKYEVWIRKGMSRLGSTFGCNGPFYALRRSLWTPIPADILLDDAWLPLTAVFKGFRLVLEPTAKAWDFPTALDSEFRRKVRTQAGLYQILRVMPEVLSSRNPMRFHFLSGKFGRVLIPYCLIILAAATFGLPAALRIPLAWLQIAFYSTAAIDLLLPSGFPLKRLTSPVRTFVVLGAAALFGVKVYFVPPRTLWKETSVRHAA